MPDLISGLSVAWGDTGSSTIAARVLEVEILLRLGKYVEALQKAEPLDVVADKTLGPLDFNRFAARKAHAQALNAVGRKSDAEVLAKRTDDSMVENLQLELNRAQAFAPKGSDT